MLLRSIDFRLAGANWQRGGGKGQRPKPVDLPDSKGRGGKPSVGSKSTPDVVQRLQALGMHPPDGTTFPQPPEIPSGDVAIPIPAPSLMVNS